VTSVSAKRADDHSVHQLHRSGALEFPVASVNRLRGPSFTAVFRKYHDRHDRGGIVSTTVLR
jgi:hypothetical protein